MGPSLCSRLKDFDVTRLNAYSNAYRWEVLSRSATEVEIKMSSGELISLKDFK